MSADQTWMNCSCTTFTIYATQMRWDESLAAGVVVVAITGMHLVYFISHDHAE